MTAPEVEIHLAVIDDHRRRPRHKAALPEATHRARLENPACGDRCELSFVLDTASDRPATLRLARFDGAGCAVSQASASLAASDLEGRTLTEAQKRIDLVLTRVLTPRAPVPPDFGTPAALAVVRDHPARCACARLAWQAAAAALATATSS